MIYTLFHESRIAGKPYGTYIMRTKVVRIYLSKFCLYYYYILHYLYYVCGSTIARVHISRVSQIFNYLTLRKKNQFTLRY